MLAKSAKAAALVILGACDSGSEGVGAASAFVERDSAGITIAITPGQEAYAPLRWEVSTTPDLQIGVRGEPPGKESQPSWQEFYKIGGVKQLSDGRVVVLDGGSREVRFFDSRGEFLDRVGGKGQGPGEFESGPVLVPAPGTDSLLLFDATLVRFHFLSSDAGGQRTIRPETWRGSRPPIGFVEASVLVQTAILPPPTGTSGALEEPVTYAWTDIATGNRTLVDSFVVRRMYRYVSERRPSGLSMIPFSLMPVAVVTRDGALITEIGSSDIREYDLDAQLRRIIRIDEPGRPVTDADLQRNLALTKEPTYPEMPIPDTMPAFDSLLIDDEGWVWARVYEWDPAVPASWIVFDTQGGRAHGAVETPAGLDIHQIGSDFILGVWTDELGVEFVRRYRLARGSRRIDGP